jgi:hypothetical protein
LTRGLGRGDAGTRVAEMASGLRAASASCGRGPRPLLCQHCDVRSEFLAINMVRIEVAANPFLEFSVSLMSGIADRVEEFGIAPGTANVFWRATCADINQSRIDDAWLRIEETLDLDRVLPAITEVVNVAQRLGANVLSLHV